MTENLHLWPVPKAVKRSGGSFRLAEEMFVMMGVEGSHGRTDWFGIERFVLEAEGLTGGGGRAEFHMAAGSGVDPRREIRVVKDESVGAELPQEIRKQAYRLVISPQGIVVAGAEAAGRFYGLQTLLQIVREVAFGGNGERRKAGDAKKRGMALPCVEIVDWPDLARRGVYHDTARGKVPTVKTLLQLIDDLAHLKYNEFQLYVENNFEFRKYPEMYDDTDPLTAEELLLLDAACRARHMDFVPSLTSLGHFEKILSRPKFRHLAEAEPAQLRAIGATCWSDQPWSLCVTDPDARAFLKGMYDEFVPNFSSGQFNICCDEAYDLGVIRSRKAAEKAGGSGHLYVEWIDYCNSLAQEHGKTIQMWGDIILNHPELIGRLPEGVTLLEWGYEHDHKFQEHCALFSQRLGLGDNSSTGDKASSFYVCPGTSSWLTLSSRTKNAFGNIFNAVQAGKKYGARGVLVTDWGDMGHQQLLAVSLLAMGYGAGAGWSLGSADPAGERNLDRILSALSLHLFQDPACEFASWAYELGRVYEVFSWQRFNASIDWWLFREKWEVANYVNRARPEDLQRVIDLCEKLIPRFGRSRLEHPQAELLIEEFVFTAEEIIHTCRRTAARQAWLADRHRRGLEKDHPENPAPYKPAPLPRGFKPMVGRLRRDLKQLRKRYEELWLARNKRSRLDDVLAEFDRLAKEYARHARG